MNRMHPGSIVRFYVEGFRSMTIGRVLWKIILLKLFVLFVILKLFFFPNYLNTHFDTDEERSNHVLNMMTRSAETHNLE